MEWAVWTASSDSEDAVTQEMNKEQGSPSKREQQDSLCVAGEQLSTKDAHRSFDLTFDKEAASTRNGRDFMDPLKTEAGKSSDKGSRDLIHFGKKRGIKRSAPDSVGSTCTVNVSEGDGIPDRDSENIAMQWLSEKEDEEQAEDLGEWAEELEYDSSIFSLKAQPQHQTKIIKQEQSKKEAVSELSISREKISNSYPRTVNGVSQKLNPGRSETQRKKRNLTQDGLGQASKLVKRLQHPQENQLPCPSTECGESASGPSCPQWNESFQSKHLKENCAAEEPVTCAESKKMLSPSSESVDHQNVHTGKECLGSGSGRTLHIFGDAYIRCAGIFIRERNEWSTRFPVNMQWNGIGGLSIDNVLAMTVELWGPSGSPPPNVLIIHAGANDLVRLGRKSLRSLLIETLSLIARLLPRSLVLWSEMIPRKVWVQGLDPSSRNASVRKINASVRSWAGGMKNVSTIMSKMLHDPSFLMQDGVHLSQQGTVLFLEGLLAALP